MALHLELDPGDILIVPKDSGAQIRVVEKSGRRARVSVDSALPIQVLRAKETKAPPAAAIQRPTAVGSPNPMQAGVAKPRL